MQGILVCLLPPLCSLQRPPLSATLRRIGNAMLGLSQCEDGGGAVLTHTPTLASNHGFCQSVDSHVRTLAVLVSLRTVVQGMRRPGAVLTAADCSIHQHCILWLLSECLCVWLGSVALSCSSACNVTQLPTKTCSSSLCASNL